MTPINQNSVPEEMRNEFNPVNACYWLVHHLLSLRLICTDIQTTINRSAIYPIVAYGHETWPLILQETWPLILQETWPLILQENHRWRVFYNRVLRKVFWLARAKVTLFWRKLDSAELHDLYTSPNTSTLIKKWEWDGQDMLHLWKENEYWILVGKREGKKTKLSTGRL